MKKFTLIAAAAMAALGANAQYNTEKVSMTDYISEASEFYVLVANDGYVNKVKEAGKTVKDFRTNDESNFLYVWDGTFIGGESTDGPGMHVEGYTSLTVGSVGWSGAGWCLGVNGDFADFSGLNKDSHFHISYRTQTTAPSIQIYIGNSDNADATAAEYTTVGKMSLGAAFEGAPVVGKALSDEWQAIDISLADLAKLYPAFSVEKFATTYGFMAKDEKTGEETPKGMNIMCLLGGGVAGQNIELDQAFFYTPAGTGVEAVEFDSNEPCEYYNMQGMRVANPEKGMFIRVQGNKAAKVVL